VRIEILTTLSGVEFNSCYENKVLDEIDGVEIAFIHLNDIIKKMLYRSIQRSRRCRKFDRVNSSWYFLIPHRFKLF
jgi:hypothetical protein